MKIFTRGEIAHELATKNTVPGVISNYAALVKTLMDLEFDVTVNEVRSLMLRPPHIDTLTGVPDDRGQKFIHQIDEHRDGDDKLPDNYDDLVKQYLATIGSGTV